MDEMEIQRAIDERDSRFMKRTLIAGGIVAGPLTGYFIGEREGAYEAGRKQVEDIRPGFTILGNNGAFQVGNPSSYLIKGDGTRKLAIMENLTSSEVRDIGRQLSPYQQDIDGLSMTGAGIGLVASLGLFLLGKGLVRRFSSKPSEKITNTFIPDTLPEEFNLDI